MNSTGNSQVRRLYGYVAIYTLLYIFCVVPAHAQRYDNIVLGPKGQPIAGASVAVCTQPATITTTPCSPLATLYTDSTLSVTAPNPTTTDGLGNYHFYANGTLGPFTVQIYGPAITTPFVMVDQRVNTSGSTPPGGSSGNIQVNNGAGGFGANSGLTSPDGTSLQSSTSGTFTTGANHLFSNFTLTGGGTCNPATPIGGPPTWVTDALTACLNLPSSSVTNGLNNAIGAYAINNNSSSSCQFSKCEVVGIFPAVAYAGAAAGGLNIGSAPQVINTTANATSLEGEEVGVVPSTTADFGMGTLYSFEGGNVQPAGDQMPASVVQTPTGTGTFTSGFECQAGSVHSGDCLVVNKFQPTGQQSSNHINLYAEDSAFTTFNDLIYLNNGHWLNIAPTSGFGGIGTPYEASLWNATAANLSPNQLLKPDTSNPDAWVVCTTADTTACAGFMGEPVDGNFDCHTSGSGFNTCPVIAASGQHAVGILGTGTCAIGNYVIVDTTTNGDIKCTGTPPAARAEIGIAMSVQSTVGQAVDVLTKFQ